MEMHFKHAAEQFFASNRELTPFKPFPKASEREAFEKLPTTLKQNLIAQGEEVLGYQYPTLRATDFMAFMRTGNRVNFEDIYFARRHALNSLVVAECVENKGRFLDDIINGIFALCEESAWQLPAHNSKPGRPNEILPDATEPVLDLFACETGALLACILYLLEEQLDAVSPNIGTRIRYELNHRIVTPYLTKQFWWMGSEDREMCNWTPWCTQNVLYTVFLLDSCARKSPVSVKVVTPSATASGNHASTEKANDIAGEILRIVLLKAASSCDYFLKDYGEDGCCDEGAQYYRHAGLCLDGAATVLNAVTDGAFTELMHLPKIKNIAAYIYNVHVDNKYYFNFADCSPIAGRAGVREYLFGKNTGQPGLMQFAAKDFKAAKGDIFSDESNKLNLFYRMQTVFCYEEVMAYASRTNSACKPTRNSPDSETSVHAVDTLTNDHRPDIFYPSVGLFLTRNQTFALAVKAGDNADSHNHNDTGSITVYKHGKPILVDIGVESYTKKTFSPQRYEIWTMQSGYHNLPTIDGLDQRDGAAYCATNIVTSMTDADASISMEIGTAYPFAENNLPRHSYVRRVSFDKENSCITLTDTTDSGNVILNFITYEKPEVNDHTILVGEATLTWENADFITVETLPITDRRLQTAWDHDLYRIRLQLTGGSFGLHIC